MPGLASLNRTIVFPLKTVSDFEWRPRGSWKMELTIALFLSLYHISVGKARRGETNEDLSSGPMTWDSKEWSCWVSEGNIALDTSWFKIKTSYVLLDHIPGENKEQNYLSIPWRIVGYLFLVQAKANYVFLQLCAHLQGRSKEDKELLGRV